VGLPLPPERGAAPQRPAFTGKALLPLAKIGFLGFLLLLCGLSLSAFDFDARSPGLDFGRNALLDPFRESAPEIGAEAAVLLDAATGTVLYSKNPTKPIPPASLTKLMTMHLAGNAVAEGRASLAEPVTLGTESWARNQPPGSSLMFLEPGQRVNLGELMLGLAVPSGNDAAVAIAMHLAGSVEAFADLMRAEATRLGLADTFFVEPAGISDLNVTTAADFAAFSLEYLHLHPENLALFHSVREFAYPLAANAREGRQGSPGTILQYNRNSLLGNFPGVDGLKTGYIDASGYNIALTAERDGTRFLAVILGGESSASRDRDGRALLAWAFDTFATLVPELPALEPVPLWKGRERQVRLVPAFLPVLTVPSGRAGSPSFSVQTETLVAPIPAFRPVGTLILGDELGELARIPLLVAQEYPAGNFFRRLWDSIRLWFGRSSGG